LTLPLDRTEEMLASPPWLAIRTRQPKPRFMNERRRLQRLAGCFVREPARRQSPDFVIVDRSQFFLGLRIAGLCAFDQACDFAHDA